MTLILAVLHLVVVLLIFLVATAWGCRVLEVLGCAAQSNLEALLFAAGFSFAALEIVLFFLALEGWLRFGSTAALLGLMVLSASRGWRQLWSASRDLLAGLRPSSLPVSERVVLFLIVAFLAIGVLLAMAPLSGSDSMRYHFTAPLLEQGRPLAPIVGIARYVDGVLRGARNAAMLLAGLSSRDSSLARRA